MERGGVGLLGLRGQAGLADTPADRCSNRTVADVSAVADPDTGVAVYDSYGSRRGANWYVYGGTSVAAPLIAGIWARAAAPAPEPAATLYANFSAWHDVLRRAATEPAGPTCARLVWATTARPGSARPTGSRASPRPDAAQDGGPKRHPSLIVSVGTPS